MSQSRHCTTNHSIKLIYILLIKNKMKMNKKDNKNIKIYLKTLFVMWRWNLIIKMMYLINCYDLSVFMQSDWIQNWTWRYVMNLKIHFNHNLSDVFQARWSIIVSFILKNNFCPKKLIINKWNCTIKYLFKFNKTKQFIIMHSLFGLPTQINIFTRTKSCLNKR